LKNKRAEQTLSRGVGEVVQIMSTHVSKNDTCSDCSGNRREGIKESSGGAELKYDIFDIL
jgi:hypothetical protein